MCFMNCVYEDYFGNCTRKRCVSEFQRCPYEDEKEHPKHSVSTKEQEAKDEMCNS